MLERFGLWRHFPMRWTVWWVLVPNLAAIAMWPIGGPSMATWMCVSGVIAFFCSQHPSRAVRIAAVTGILLLNAGAYLALSFNLKFYNFIMAARLVMELNPLNAPEYVIAGVVAVAALVLAIRHAPKTGRFASREQRLLAFAALAIVVNLDTMATAGTRGSYMATAPDGAPVESAIAQNRIAPDTVAARNLVVIVVESLGVPAAEEDRRLFAAIWNPARWSSRYEVRQGTAPYYGSTTNAELREWCGAWADHQGFDFDRARCLPEAFRDAGFRTIALHSFRGEFFDRRIWYPKIGFQQTLFEEQLKHAGAGACEGVFPGACDRDVPRIIGDVLRRSRDRRNLVYWLTLNAHLPVPQDASLKTMDCRMGSPEWRDDFPGLCRNLTLHQQLADAVSTEIMRPDFPEADILIVGDHMPPFFQRDIRSRFDAARVPWIHLRNRAAERRRHDSKAPAGGSTGA